MFLQETQISSLNKQHDENSACSPKQQLVNFSSYLLQELLCSRDLNYSNTLPFVRVKTIYKLLHALELPYTINNVFTTIIKPRIYVYRCALHTLICILT
jgi:hypothetical protein